MLSTIVSLLVAGCSPSAAPGQTGPSSGGTGPTRVVAAILSDPPSLYPALNPSSIRGGEAIEDLANSGLSVVDSRGSLRPRLAQEVPSVENGLWRILPDGRAETTWKIREDVQWHDGAPFNGEDLVFTVRVLQDKELAMVSHQAFGFVERVEARDPYTVTVGWKQPYIDADRMFTRGLASPLPRHLLERPYQQDKERFIGLPYWSVEYVGTGPFRLKNWVIGSHLMFAANDQYVLGRAKIDEIEVRFIPDPNTVLANALVGQFLWS